MRVTSIDVRTASAPSWLRSLPVSDLNNFWKFGFLAVLITDTAHYRNPHYHSKADRMDTLCFEKMEEVVNGVIWALLNLS
jgi:hypothetical protein